MVTLQGHTSNADVIIIIIKSRAVLSDDDIYIQVIYRCHCSSQLTKQPISLQVVRTGNTSRADPEGAGGGAGGLSPHPLKYHKNIGFSSNTDPDPLKNHKATKPALNVGSSSVRQRNDIYISLAGR